MTRVMRSSINEIGSLRSFDFGRNTNEGHVTMPIDRIQMRRHRVPHVDVEGRRRASILFVIACAALALGTAVYFTDRRPADAMLLAAFKGMIDGGAFGTVAQWLPSFVHPFAFSLLTAAVLRPTVILRYGACAFWCAINLGFEVGQLAAFKSRWVEALQSGAGDWLITRSALNYLFRGTFDPGDVCAVVLGALSAALVLHWIDHTSEPQHARY